MARALKLSTASPVMVYSFGLCYASVCAPKDMEGEKVAEEADYVHPTGLDHGWSVSDDKNFRSGETNPCECNHEADRRHWLLSC